MSGILPSGRYLRWRAGPYPSARLQTVRVGSTCTLIFELVDTNSRALVPADGLSVIYIRPRLVGSPPVVGIPVGALLLQPGQWQVDIPMEVPGLYRIDGVIIGERVETTTAKIVSI